MKDFTILKPVANSGNSESFLAREETLGRKVVLRILDDASEKEWKHFQAEAELLGDLKDPRILKIHRFGQWQGRRAMAVEYVEGIPFSQLQEQLPKSMTERIQEVLRLGIQLGEALSKIHVLGVIHRNLNPGSLILHPSGLPKILDFGLAREVNQQSLSRSLEENRYLSPEQKAVPRRPVDYRSDLFSLATVLEELLPAHLPVNLARVLTRARSWRPEDRYESAEAMTADLRRCQAGQSISRTRRHWGSLLRHPATLAASLLVFGGILWNHHVASMRKAEPEKLAALGLAGEAMEKQSRTLLEKHGELPHWVQEKGAEIFNSSFLRSGRNKFGEPVSSFPIPEPAPTSPR